MGEKGLFSWEGKEGEGGEGGGGVVGPGVFSPNPQKSHLPNLGRIWEEGVDGK